MAQFDFSGAVAGAEVLLHTDSYLLPEGTLAFTFTADTVDLIDRDTEHHVAVTFGGADGLAIYVDGSEAANVA